MMSLSEYIKINHGGNRSAFARAIGVKRFHISNWLKSSTPVYVVDGKVVRLMLDFNDMRLITR
jgi:DNA-binding transcriptional regulator YdaS (Cro superfamily)